MNAISLNKLDIFNTGSIIYCHPENYDLIKKKVEVLNEDNHNIPPGIFRPNTVEIRANAYLEKEKQIGWQLVEPYKSDPLITWVEDNEIDNPPSWAIFFKMVVPKSIPVVYIVNHKIFSPI